MVMAQIALGFRSLLTKAIVFFVMAALLAWALGGTLWPRQHVVYGGIAEVKGDAWWWQMKVGGGVDEPRWTMMRQHDGGAARELEAAHVFTEVAGPVVRSDQIAFAGLSTPGGWRLFVVEPAGIVALPMPDRLAVEQQLARFQAGLAIQDFQTITRQRSAVIDPADEE